MTTDDWPEATVYQKIVRAAARRRVGEAIGVEVTGEGLHLTADEVYELATNGWVVKRAALDDADAWGDAHERLMREEDGTT